MDLLIRWSGTQWLLEDVGEDLLYYSSDDVATPDLVTTWEADNGDEPVPVVSDATNAPDGYLLAADGSGDCVFDPPSWFSSPDGGRYVPMGIATGQYAISEGILADASGNYSHAEGYITEASGNYSHAEGNETEASGEASHAEGSKSTASGNYSHAEGLESQARLPGSYASSSVNYEQQHARYLLNATTSDDTPQEMLCGTERLAVPIDTVYVFRALVSGSKANAVQVAGYEFAGVIKNASGTTSIVGAVTKTVLAEEDAAWDCDITADNANDALTITVTGVAATSIRWQATVWTSEIQYP
jgi:hypothetical protein